MQILIFISLLVATTWAVPLEEIEMEDSLDNKMVKRQVQLDESINQAVPKMTVEINNGMAIMTSITNDQTIGSNRSLSVRTTPINYPNSPPCVYSTNCNFIGLDLYVVLNILDPLVCGSQLCGSDPKCTHFHHNPNVGGGTCTLKSAPGSGGAWSTPTPAPSGTTCGHIPTRSCGSGALISLCLGLNVNLGGLLGGIL